MNQDHSFRSRFRSAKARRKLPNKRCLFNSRVLRVEQLEQRSLLAGLHGAESGSIPTPGSLNTESLSYKYYPTKHYAADTAGYLTGPSSAAPLQIAIDFLTTNAPKFGLKAADLSNLALKNQYTDPDSHGGVTHLYFKQTFNNLEIGNADLSINIAKNGEIINIASTFVGNLTHPSTQQALLPGVGSAAAFLQFGEDFGYTFSSQPQVISAPQGHNQRTVLSGGGVAGGNVIAELQYIANSTGLELTWRMNVPTSDQLHWYDTFQGADDGGLVFMNDWVANASYNVFPLPASGPNDGVRSIVVDPQDPIASPYGWHDVNGQPGADFCDTRGNNVMASEDRNGFGSTTGNPTPALRPNGCPNLNFDFPLNLGALTTAAFTDASVVNMFYLSNMAHDITYRYGFDEASGNFQSLNYGQTGRGGDPILALGQSDGNAIIPINNAFMATPPDGFQPLMIMGEFNVDFTSPNFPFYQPRRDTSLVADVVLHEYFHGVTNRLTGGANNAGALQAQQSRSMGEGWSDFFALWALQDPTDLPADPVEVGPYLTGPAPAVPGKGIRRNPYSFDLSVNPIMFSDFNAAGGVPLCQTGTSNCEVHNAGEIWASILWDLNWILQEKYGFDPDVFAGTGGNNLAMELVIQGLKLQPANPTWTQARDGILQADIILYRGAHHKEIWTAFARRGMGFQSDADSLDLGVQGPFPFPPIFIFLDSPNSLSVRASFDIPNSPGRIRGTVFNDANGNGIFDAQELGIGGVTMFLDVDNDGIFDPLEPTTITAADGSYEFQIFVRGDFRVGQVVPPGLQQTTPPGIGGQTVTVINGQTVSNVNFGDRAGNALTTGIVFNDFDGDGRRDSDEPGLAGVYIYADYDGDKRLDLSEPQTVTNQDGFYTLKLDRPGTYFVRQVIPAGFAQTFPTNNGGFQVTIVTGSLNANFEFGNTAAEDWGDAPASYRTLAADNGAVHGSLPGFFLGASVDLESDGKPSATADGDDLSGIDDEDGVQFTSSLFPGSTSNVSVTVNLKDRITETVNGRLRTTVLQDNSGGRLHAWVDFNRDGDFDDSGEKIFTDLLLFEGVHNLSYNVPRSATPGVTFARFRYTYEHQLGPNGRAIAGEVEDYGVRILTDTPDAVDDVFTVDQNTVANVLNVLANDVPSASGPLTILSFTPSSRGATIVISPDGLSLRYTPQRGSIGSDSFTYTVRDPSGATDTARVSVTILPSFSQPIAVDDSIDVNENSSNNVINVLANDLPGRFPPIGIVFPGSPSNGFVEVDNRGTTTPSDDVLRYTPDPGFAGTDQFQYTIEDAQFQQSTATVTVHVQPGDQDDDIVQYRLEATDINNRPIQAIGVGETFKIRAYVKDLRLDDTVDDGVDRRGVGAAYFDALYPFALVSLQGSISFPGQYTNATSGNVNTPGLIDEAGALQNGTEPLGANELLLYEVFATATGVGSAQFVGDPADRTSENPGSPDHDTILFEPPQNAVQIKQLRFVNSTLQIVGTGGRPIATDNTFTIPANVLNFPLNVLANDVEVNNPPLRITAVGSSSTTTFTTANGSQVRISADGQLLLFTPRNGFNGTDQFTYTVSNAVNLTSSALVTVQVGAPTKDITIRLEATNLQGQPLTGPILVGDDFLVRVLVQDIRSNPPDRTRMGVFAAYLDLLYDGELVSTIGDINTPFGFRMQFGPEYNVNGLSASNALPNVIDELGAFQTSFGPLGPNEFLLAAVTFNADEAGTASFVSDPADLSPLHDVLLFEPDDAAVPLSRVNFRTTSVIIVGAGEGEAYHNFTIPEDVNGDGARTPIDALMIINDLNANGARYLYGSAAGGEGETGTKRFLDVNRDGWATPIDALQTINALVRTGAGEGESTGNLLDLSQANTAMTQFVLPDLQLSMEHSDAGPPTTPSQYNSSALEISAATPAENHSCATQVRDDLFAEFDSKENDDNKVEELLAEDVGSEWWKN